MAVQQAAISDVKVTVTVEADARIIGKVKDPAGNPVSGVKVRAKGAGSDSTDSDGNYEIDVPEKKRTYKVVPKKGKNKFKPRSRRVKVTPGQTKRADFRMKGFVIEGKIRQACDGSVCFDNPIGGARVIARNGKRKVRATTDADGNYSLVVPRKATWRVTPKGNGMVMKPKQRKVRLRSSKKGKQNFDACAGSRGGSPSLTQSSLTDFAGSRRTSDCQIDIKIFWDDDRGEIDTIQASGRVVCDYGSVDKVESFALNFARLKPTQPNQSPGSIARRYVGEDVESANATLSNLSEVTAIYSAGESPPTRINIPWLAIDYTVSAKATSDRKRCGAGWRGEDFYVGR